MVHPAAGTPSGTLANALAYHFQQLPDRGAGVRPGIVHRLDRDTSGLLVVAKTEAALENLSDQFRDRTVFKSYVALVHGRVSPDSGKIDQPLARDPSNRTRMAVVRGGRNALTLYRVRRSFDRFTLLDVELKTGRTHQIRVHLAWMKASSCRRRNLRRRPRQHDSRPAIARPGSQSQPPLSPRRETRFTHPETKRFVKFEVSVAYGPTELLLPQIYTNEHRSA